MSRGEEAYRIHLRPNLEGLSYHQIELELKQLVRQFMSPPRFRARG